MPTNYLTTDTDLTSVANAIRAKSGGSSQLAFPAGFVSEIGNIPSGGGGLSDIPWVATKETVTIGANSITKGDAVKTYFSSYGDYFLVVLKTAPTAENQTVAIGIKGTGFFLRYKSNNVVSANSLTGSYDAKLIEGTQYDVYTW